MAKKTVLVQIRVNNSGLDFEDDITSVWVDIPAELTSFEFWTKLNELNKELAKEDDDGECYYSHHGYCSDTLMSMAKEKFGWEYKVVVPELFITIE